MQEISGWRIDPAGRATCERCGLVTRIAASDPLPIRHACRAAANTGSSSLVEFSRKAGKPGREEEPGPSNPRLAQTQNPSPPNLAWRVWNFAVAVAQHAAAGLPLCTQAELDARLAVCASCPLFNGTVCTHRDCGCPIGRDRRFWKKLAWADQACPLGKWAAAG